MSIKKNIAFLVHTEYHLLISSSIISAHFNDTTTFENRIYNLFSKRKLVEGLNTHLVSNEFKVICSEGNKQIKSDLQEIIEFAPDFFFYFQEGSPINYYIVANLSKKGTKIALVQDGLKAYSIVNKRFEGLAIIRDTFRSYKHLFDHKLPLWKAHLFKNYKYGVTKEINELWVSHPDAFVKNNKKLIRKIPEISEKNRLELIRGVFNFEQDRFLTSGDDKVIFYINQPFYNNNNIAIEYLFLKKLIETNNSIKGVYVKIHRSTSEYHLNFYKKLPIVTIIYDNIPAELLVLSLNNSIVLSGWSTTLLTFNPTCNYYYNYPIYEKDVLLSQSYPFNPTDYIKVIDSVEAISFPNSA